MDFRLADRADLHQVGRLGNRATEAEVGRLIDDPGLVATSISGYSARSLVTWIDEGSLVVCESEPGLVAGFAMFETASDHVHLHRVHADPAGSAPEEVITGLLTWARQRDPHLAVSTDITLGSVEHETASRHAGFSPGETAPSPVHGPAVVDRRWWAPPLTENGV